MAKYELRGRGRIGSVGLSALVRMLTFPVTAVATFLATSLTIGYAGATGYAALTVIVTLSQLAPYADLGIGAGVINVISMSNSCDPIRLRATASAIRILLISATVVLVVGALGMTVFSWSSLLNIGRSGLPNLDIVTFLVILVFAISIPMGIGQRILLALMMNPIAVAVTALAPVLALVGTVLIVGLKLPQVLLVFPPVLGGLVSAFISITLAVRKLKFRWDALWHLRTFRLPGLLSQGMWYLTLSVASALAFQWGRVILASRGSLHDVATYSIAMQFYAPLWSFFVAAGTSLWPVFARSRALNESQSALLLRMISWFAGASLVCVAGLVLFGPWFASLISHDAVRTGALVFLSCGALIVAQSAQLVLGVSLTSPRDLRFQALWGIPMAVSVITATWLLAPALGAIAPFVATSAGVLLLQVTPNILRAMANEKRIVASNSTQVPVLVVE